MRVLILPLVIVLSFCSIESFSQGTTCVNAFDIANTCATPASISATAGAPIGTCSAGTSKRITYFQFTAGTTCPAISFDISVAGAFQVVAYSACPDGAGNIVAGTTGCFANNSGVWSPSAALTAGSVYYLRVWTNATAGTIRACNISANANDLDVTGSCSSFPMATTIGQPIGTCAPGGQKNVTWFKFTADVNCPMLSIDNSLSKAGTPIANEVSVFPACGNAAATLSAIAAGTSCVANGSVLWAPPAGTVVAGNTYYLRVWTNTTAAGNLNICNVINVAQQLDLDQSCYPIDLSAASSGGTVSSIANCPMASNANRRITWVKFHTSAANRCVTINVTNAGVKTEMALYGGGCGAAVKANTSVCYTDGTGVWSAGPNYPANGYTPGTDYYLRIYTDVAPDGSSKQITLCGTEKTQATNDDCTNAAAFTYTAANFNNACAHYAAGEGLNNSGTDAAKICAYGLQNTVWYKFKIANTGTRASVTISNIDCDSYTNDNQLLQMGLLTGNCGGFNPAISPGPSGSPAFPTSNSLASPTSCLATSGNAPVTLYTSTAVTYGQIVYLAIDGYSGANCKFTLQASQNIIPIPIHLKYFTAWKTNATNLVRWVTAFEHNNAYFEVERSLDGVSFETLGRVPGRTESSTDQTYDFEDKFPPALAYYRLKQVDIDGKYELSPIVQLVRDQNMKFAVSTMPNPVQNTARIAISTDQTGNVNMRVIDASGRQLVADVISCVKGNNVIMKDFSRLPAGTYYIAISQDDKRAVKTFIKR